MFDLREAVERAARKIDKFTRKMVDNILYNVETVLYPRINTSLIEARMNKEDAELINSDARKSLKHEYLFLPSLPSDAERPSGMPEFLWNNRVQPHPCPQISDVDRYLDSAPVSWLHPSLAMVTVAGY